MAGLFKGQWVAKTRGVGAGRVGMVDAVGARQVIVKFGPDGPFLTTRHHMLRPATREEIAQKEGVHPSHVVAP